MYPDLSYLSNDIFHTPVDNYLSHFKTYGLFLIFAFLVCSLLLRKEFKRKEDLGFVNPIAPVSFMLWIEHFYVLLSSSIVGFKLIYLLTNFRNTHQNIRDVLFSWQGNYIGAAVFFAITAVIIYRTNKHLDNKDYLSFHKMTLGLTIATAIFAMIGIKLFGVLEVSFFNKTFYEILNQSGTNFFGGLAGGLLAGFMFCYIYKVPFYHLFDSVAPIIRLGYAIGRLGCHVVGDGCWGLDNTTQKPNWLTVPDWLWAYNYPHNVSQKGIKIASFEGTYDMILAKPVLPTSLYEATFGIIMFFVLWNLRKKISHPYVLFMLFIFSMGIERFFIEFIRINPKYSFFVLNLSQAQYISVVLIIISSLFLLTKKSVTLLKHN